MGTHYNACHRVGVTCLTSPTEALASTTRVKKGGPLYSGNSHNTCCLQASLIDEDGSQCGSQRPSRNRAWGLGGQGRGGLEGFAPAAPSECSQVWVGRPRSGPPAPPPQSGMPHSPSPSLFFPSKDASSDEYISVFTERAWCL